jgi:hypothetical protein
MGYERSLGGPNDWGLNAGMYIPVGLHRTFPMRDNSWFNSIGVFLSMIDLGIYVTYRDIEGVESQSTIGFREIFSPGVFFTSQIVGPATFGIGISATPGLLERSDNPDGTKLAAIRGNAFVAIDVTLMPF